MFAVELQFDNANLPRGQPKEQVSHKRSLLIVRARDSNCKLLQTAVAFLQTRSEVGDGGTKIYSVEALHDVNWAQTRLLTIVGPIDWY